jgi:hypothetical protein
MRAREEPRRRWRDDDLGPPVTGFGDEVPAFMLLPTRGRRPVHDELPAEDITPDETLMEAGT